MRTLRVKDLPVYLRVSSDYWTHSSTSLIHRFNPDPRPTRPDLATPRTPLRSLLGTRSRNRLLEDLVPVPGPRTDLPSPGSQRFTGQLSDLVCPVEFGRLPHFTNRPWAPAQTPCKESVGPALRHPADQGCRPNRTFRKDNLVLGSARWVRTGIRGLHRRVRRVSVYETILITLRWRWSSESLSWTVSRSPHQVPPLTGGRRGDGRDWAEGGFPSVVHSGSDRGNNRVPNSRGEAGSNTHCTVPRDLCLGRTGESRGTWDRTLETRTPSPTTGNDTPLTPDRDMDPLTICVAVTRTRGNRGKRRTDGRVRVHRKEVPLSFPVLLDFCLDHAA